MEDFVPFELAKKLKEKGFTCKCPFAMYNEDGDFCALYTSADVIEVDNDGLQVRDYYSFVDFDEKDCIAPTISQVLKWLREEKKIHIFVDIYKTGWFFCINKNIDTDYETFSYDFEPTKIEYYDCYDAAVLMGIEYVLDNLICYGTFKDFCKNN